MPIQLFNVGDGLVSVTPKSNTNTLDCTDIFISPPTIIKYHLPLVFTNCNPCMLLGKLPPKLPKLTAVGVFNKLLP